MAETNETNAPKESNEIEQGNALIQLLSFAAGVASCLLAVFSVIHLGEVLSNLINYMIAVYQLIFALTTLLFEAKPEWLQKFEDTVKLPVSSYQDTLIRNAHFLTYAGGRGMFYLFQGSLWLGLHPESTHLFALVTGLGQAVVGLVHIMMHFGIMPAHVVAKVQDVGQRSYDHLAGKAGP
jgi:hypothetical protein